MSTEYYAAIAREIGQCDLLKSMENLYEKMKLAGNEGLDIDLEDHSDLREKFLKWESEKEDLSSSFFFLNKSYHFICWCKELYEILLMKQFLTETDRDEELSKLLENLRSYAGILGEGDLRSCLERFAANGRVSCPGSESAAVDADVSKMATEDLEVCASFYLLLSHQQDVDREKLERVLVTGDMLPIKDDFSGIYTLMRWISIVSRLKCMRGRADWIKKAAMSIGKTKNDCENALRKCNSVEVLQLCQKFGVQLYDRHEIILKDAPFVSKY